MDEFEYYKDEDYYDEEGSGEFLSEDIFDDVDIADVEEDIDDDEAVNLIHQAIYGETWDEAMARVKNG